MGARQWSSQDTSYCRLKRGPVIRAYCRIFVSLNTMNPATPPPPEKVNQILTTLGGWDGRLLNGLLERKIAILFERLKALN